MKRICIAVAVAACLLSPARPAPAAEGTRDVPGLGLPGAGPAGEAGRAQTPPRLPRAPALDARARQRLRAIPSRQDQINALQRVAKLRPALQAALSSPPADAGASSAEALAPWKQGVVLGPYALAYPAGTMPQTGWAELRSERVCVGGELETPSPSQSPPLLNIWVPDQKDALCAVYIRPPAPGGLMVAFNMVPELNVPDPTPQVLMETWQGGRPPTGDTSLAVAGDSEPRTAVEWTVLINVPSPVPNYLVLRLKPPASLLPGMPYWGTLSQVTIRKL